MQGAFNRMALLALLNNLTLSTSLLNCSQLRSDRQRILDDMLGVLSLQTDRLANSVVDDLAKMRQLQWLLCSPAASGTNDKVKVECSLARKLSMNDK